MPADPKSRAERRQAEVARRRAAVDRRQGGAGRRGKVNRLWLAAVVTAVAVGAGAVALTQRPRGASIDRTGSKRVDGPAVALRDLPQSYRVAYAVTEPGVGRSTQALEVRRPGQARLESHGPGDSSSVTIVVTGARLDRRGTAADVITAVPPGPNELDVRYDAIDAAATAAHLTEAREVREVAGRRCQVRRTGNRLSGTRLRAATATTYVDTCLDASGLILEEVDVRDDRLALRRLATAVEPGFVAGDDRFAIDPAAPRVPVDKGGGAVVAKGDDDRPLGRSYTVGTPVGFTRKGRSTVIPPQPENFTDPMREGFRRASTVDLFVRGADVISFEQGSTLRGGDPFDGDTGGTPVQVPGFGAGRLVVAGPGLEIVVALGGGRYIRLLGTVPQAELLAVATGTTEVTAGA